VVDCPACARTFTLVRRKQAVDRPVDLPKHETVEFAVGRPGGRPAKELHRTNGLVGQPTGRPTREEHREICVTDGRSQVDSESAS